MQKSNKTLCLLLGIGALAFAPLVFAGGQPTYEEKLQEIYKKVYAKLGKHRKLCSRAKPVYHFIYNHLPQVVCTLWGTESSWRKDITVSSTGDWCPLQVNKKTWEKFLKQIGIIKDWEKDILTKEGCLKAALATLLRNISVFCCSRVGKRLCEHYIKHKKYVYFLALHNSPFLLYQLHSRRTSQKLKSERRKYLLRILNYWNKCTYNLKEFKF